MRPAHRRALVALVAGWLAAAPVTAGELRTHDLVADGGARTYLVYEPDGATERGPLPTVLLLHGPADTIEATIVEHGWSALADAAGLLVVAPEAGAAAPELPARHLYNPRLWNEGRGDEPPAVRERDDVAFLLAALDDAARRYPVDPTRVYAVGFGGGGGMVHRLAAARPERLAAATTVAGILHGGVRPSGPVPMLMIFGGADPMLPLGGGIGASPWRSGGTTAPITVTVDSWRGPLACAETPSNAWPAPTVQRLTWPCAGAGERLAVVIVHDMGHRWPGSPEGPLPRRIVGPPSDALDATLAAWEFLAPHTR